MTKSQELALEASKIRGELAKLAEAESPDREAIAKMRDEYQNVEARFQAAVVAEDEPEPVETDPERKEVERRASVGAIFESALSGGKTDGATKELQDELGLAANQVPLALLETRAVTPAPANVGQNQAAIIPAVFPQSCAAWLGVDMPTVGVGEAVYPVMTNRPVVAGPLAASESVSDSTGAFDADVISPGRLQVSYFYRRVDRARFAGMDNALRMNLSDALADALDKQVLSGNDGLLGGSNVDNVSTNAVDTWMTYRKRLAYDRVDGIYASMTGELKVVVGAATYQHASEQYRTGNNTEQSALEQLMVLTGGVKVSANIAGPVSNKQNVIVRRGMRRDMVAATWEGVTLIPDEITKAKTGEIVITAVMLFGQKVIRKAGFAKVEAKIA